MIRYPYRSRLKPDLQSDLSTMALASSNGDVERNSIVRGAPPKSRRIQASLDHNHLIVSGIDQCPICCHTAKIQTTIHSPVVRYKIVSLIGFVGSITVLFGRL